MQSTMFLTSVTCIDHAVITPLGTVMGGSFSPDFYVTGEVTEDESVVIDFSKCKKQIKALIDDKETGFDHKLWIIPGWSNCEYEYEGDQITITTPAVTIKGPANIAKVFDVESNYADAGYEIADYLVGSGRGLEDVSIAVVMDPSVQYTIPARLQPSFFRYSHGLKDSSSWGCQNIAHGHLSYLALDCDHPMAYEMQNQIATYLNNSMFVTKENWNYETNTIEYTSPRGTFSLKLNNADQKIMILESETTIENIVETVAEVFKSDLDELGVTALYISEGVHKGAVKFLNDEE